MELGNMLFGNSRGEFPVPRTDEFGGPWEAFTEALNISWRGEPDDGCKVPLADKFYGVENDTFLIRCYDWDAECDCGAEAKMDAWHGRNHHADDCYQTELHGRLKSWEDRSGYTATYDRAFGRNDDGPLPGMNMTTEEVEPGVLVMDFAPRSDAAMNAYRKLSDRRSKVQEALYAELTAKHKKPMRGCAVHCTCGRDERAEVAWQMIGGHKDDCRLIQPNFLFKPTGFRMNWYKYPFRDSYMSAPLEPAEWQEIMRACTASALPSDGAGHGTASTLRR